MEALAGIFLVFCAGFFYFLPWIIAWARDHHQIGAIAIVNIFLGWTFIGWVVSLAWSASAVRSKE
ncbi:MAG TPA: superinfection immunity protein [Candidatus Accumulibacter phosphatis]|nr:superinfection immunity protein [Candidatus Accumulibacter phosphatis]